MSEDQARINMKHGAGGRAMRELIDKVFAKNALRIDGFGLDAMDDGAAIRLGDRWLIMTTDSHVIHPLFFPGGDIGRLAISGTVNDLAMMGATQVLGLTCAVVLEDGFPLDKLEQIQQSMVATCREAEAPIVTGDTKVMGRGELDGIVINTSGVAITEYLVRDSGAAPGDRIIITGTIADHGLAVMAARNKLGLEGTLRSDVAPIGSLVKAALAAGGEDIRAMKDPTRGGVASTLHEMSAKAKVGIVLHEDRIPLSDAARAASELLGIDPLHVANEGKAVIVVRARSAEKVRDAIRRHPLGKNAAIAGEVIATHPGQVILDTGFGRRLLAEPEGELLPRIC